MLGLDGKLAHCRIVLQGDVITESLVVGHLGGIVTDCSGHVNILVQIYSHHGLELPQGEDNGAFGIVDIRNRTGDCRLRTGEVKFRRLLRIVAEAGLLEVPHCIVIHVLIYVQGLLGKKNGIVGLLHLGHHIQP